MDSLNEQLIQIGLKLSQVLEPERLLAEVLKEMVQLVDSEGGTIYIYDEIANTLRGEYALTAKPGMAEKLKTLEISLGVGIAGKCAQERKPILLNDVDEQSGYLPALDRAVGYQTKSLLTVPVEYVDLELQQPVLVGVLQAVNKRSGDYTGEDLETLQKFSSLTAVLLERMKLYNSMKESLLGVISSLARAVDARDPYTHDHTHRVSMFVSNLGHYLSLNPRQLYELHISSLLHDIGKIAIPDEILRKSGKLTDEEWVIMKKHPEEGHRILQPVRLSREILFGVLHHHENWDGTGYPSGLKGEETPLFARIIHIADAYDALISDRPYRKGLSPWEAKKEIERKAGSQFDPQMVEIFSKNFFAFLR